jgi:hypothetical protein
LKRVRMTWVVGVWLAVASTLVACMQDEGQTCQVNPDCSSGLVCLRCPGSARGVCHVKTDVACGSNDAGSTPDDDAGKASAADTNMSRPNDAG